MAEKVTYKKVRNSNKITFNNAELQVGEKLLDEVNKILVDSNTEYKFIKKFSGSLFTYILSKNHITKIDVDVKLKEINGTFIYN